MFTWSRYSTAGYEVSSKGDKRFSAFYAMIKPNTLIDIGCKCIRTTEYCSIEKLYQVDIKGYPSLQQGKGKPPLNNISKETQYNLYKELWKTWVRQNPKTIGNLLDILLEANIRVLTDMFATTEINQARALAEILSTLDEEG